MLVKYISDSELSSFVKSTLKEDFGTGGDVTSTSIVPLEARLNAVIAARDNLTLAGLEIASAFFKRLDPDVIITSKLAMVMLWLQGQPLWK